MKRLSLLFLVMFVMGAGNGSHEVETNSVHMASAPGWVTRVKVDKVIDHIQMVLEWDIRRIEAYWHSDATEFAKGHGRGPLVMAYSLKDKNAIHLGPKVTDANFNAYFGHELVHIIAYQKYKQAIPKWLEEGLANYLAKTAKVDYHWLSSQAAPKDVRELTHPFDGSEDRLRYHYMASQALVEMIAAKCDLANLLRLSVGEKMDGYLDTYCEIRDLNAAFKAWVAKRGK